MIKTTNGFAKLSLAEFGLQLNHIVASMTGNPEFPNLQTPVQTIGSEATAFTILVQKATDWDAKAILARDTTRDAITAMLQNRVPILMSWLRVMSIFRVPPAFPTRRTASPALIWISPPRPVYRRR